MGIKYSFDKGIYSFVAGVSSPTMAAVLSGNNVEEEYMWSCTLDKTNTELCWSPADPADSQDDEEDDPNVKPGHRLLIKNAILMPEAKKDVVHVVQIECEGYNKQKVVAPIVAMKAGVDHQEKFGQRIVDINGKSVLLVAVSRFSTSKSVVTINLKNLDCSTLSFDTSLDPTWLDQPESPEPNK